MADSPRLAIPLMADATEQNFATYSAGMAIIDQKLNVRVLDELTAPPGGESEGDMYLVIATATGDFATHEDELAYFINAAYVFYVAEVGQTIYIDDADVHKYWDGTNWVQGAAGTSIEIEDNDSSVGTADTLNFEGRGIKASTDEGGGKVTMVIETNSVGVPTEETGTTYTLALTDAGGIVRMNNASANTVTVPLNSAVAFAIGDIVDLTQMGAGQTDVTPEGGVTLRSPGAALKARLQYSTLSLIKIATDEWIVAGDSVV